MSKVKHGKNIKKINLFFRYGTKHISTFCIIPNQFTAINQICSLGFISTFFDMFYQNTQDNSSKTHENFHNYRQYFLHKDILR